MCVCLLLTFSINDHGSLELNNDFEILKVFPLLNVLGLGVVGHYHLSTDLN